MQPLEAASSPGKMNQSERRPAPLTGTFDTPIANDVPLIEWPPRWGTFAFWACYLAVIVAAAVWLL